VEIQGRERLTLQAQQLITNPKLRIRENISRIDGMGKCCKMCVGFIWRGKPPGLRKLVPFIQA